MNVIFAGGRDFTDTNVAVEICKDAYKQGFLPYVSELTGISGKARGADTVFSDIILASGSPVHEFPAKWKDMCARADNPVVVATRAGSNYNKLAGFNRNRLMAEIGEKLVAVWDGSGGTADMIKAMIKVDKPVLIYDYKGNQRFEFIKGSDSKEANKRLNELQESLT